MKKLTKQQVKKITNELVTFYIYNLTKEMYINDGYYIDMFEFFFVLIEVYNGSGKLSDEIEVRKTKGEGFEKLNKVI